MAEALRTDKVEDDRSNAIFTTYLKNPTKKTVDALSRLNLPAGVEVKIKA